MRISDIGRELGVGMPLLHVEESLLRWQLIRMRPRETTGQNDMEGFYISSGLGVSRGVTPGRAGVCGEGKGPFGLLSRASFSMQPGPE